MLGLHKHSNSERGDTIIEVLFAISVFSLVAVGGLSLMNQGTAAAERSLEITLVRDQVDGQVDALQFLHSAYIASYTNGGTKISANASGTPAEQWRYIVDNKATVASPTDFTQDAQGSCNLPSGSIGSFAIEPASMRLLQAPPVQPAVYARINASGKAEGLWIEAIGPSSATDDSHTHFIEFYVRACWGSVGSSVPMTLGTVLRLYEPL